METSLIHESVKQRIFDMRTTEILCEGTRSEDRDYKQAMGNRSISEIPESIIPTKEIVPRSHISNPNEETDCEGEG